MCIAPKRNGLDGRERSGCMVRSEEVNVNVEMVFLLVHIYAAISPLVSGFVVDARQKVGPHLDEQQP